MDSFLKEIATDGAPGAIGPYSQAVRAGNAVYTSGQIPVDPKTGEVVTGGIKKQTAQCLKNIAAVLDAAGCALTDIVKTTVFITDMSAFTDMNEVYSGFFSRPFPARSCVQVCRLPKDVLVEIEAIAIKGGTV